jgi:hypothetical protein
MGKKKSKFTNDEVLTMGMDSISRSIADYRKTLDKDILASNLLTATCLVFGGITGSDPEVCDADDCCEGILGKHLEKFQDTPFQWIEKGEKS